MFPGVPIVFCGADSRFLATQNLAQHITGISSLRDIAGTLEMALQIHPETQRVVVIVGAGIVDKKFERIARADLQAFASKLEFTWMQGAPLNELIEVTSRLPPHTVILYLVQLEDKNGHANVPILALEQISKATKAPIYVLWDTLMGHGVLGGRLATVEEEGFQAAQMGIRILRGEAPADIPVIDAKQNRAIFDGRELARWNIDEKRLPEGSLNLFPQDSFWDEHRFKIQLTLLIVGIQGFLIFALLMSRSRLRRSQSALRGEYDRRQQSEAVTSELRERLTRFSKERTLGMMTTGIAHEVNQPLSAIQNYALAGIRRSQRDTDETAKMSELFGKIEQQASRAGDIIQHIRILVSTDDAEMHPVSLDSILELVIQIMRPLAESQTCHLELRPATNLPLVLADEVEIQLVLVNLIQNALQSMESMTVSPEKVITIEYQQVNEQEVQISVADRGPGILPEKKEEIFEPFYSTHFGGMGMGLAICRVIIDVHGGKIWCTTNPDGGSIFHFTLRLAGN